MESYESVLDSGVKDQEIIFVDDGSIDDTRELIARIQSGNAAVTFLRNSQNLGGGATRNKGVQQAKNPFIFILDSDDVLVPGSLSLALRELELTNADAVATSQSVFFSENINHPSKKIEYKSGYANFENLVSHIPNPVIGNLLFTKQVYFGVGGYPTHHSFDTQGFGFRLLQNRKKILVGSAFMYFQRLPISPSYYAREARAGNINRNWFYIFNECLYKFSPRIRKLILEFSYADPSALAKGRHLFNVLADESGVPDFYCEEGLQLDDDAAYRRHVHSDDQTMSAWCATYEIKNHLYDAAISRLQNTNPSSFHHRLLYPLIAKTVGAKFTTEDVVDFSYFFAKHKSCNWRFGLLRQKIYNKMKISRYFLK